MRTAVIAATLLLAACSATPEPAAPPAPPAESARFVASEAAYINRPGSGRIEGRAFLDGASAAGESVVLMPVTAYTRDFIARGMGGGFRDRPLPDEIERYIKITTAYAGGRFEFGGLPAGRYYLLTRIPDGAGGRFLTGEVSVADGRASSVTLDR